MKEVKVVPLFPPSPNEVEDFDAIDCNPFGPEVNIIDDEELSGRPVIDIVGEDSRITFHSNSSLNMLVMHVNSNSRFFSIIIRIRDDAGKDRVLQLSNKKSTIMILEDTCKVPMEVGEGWQRICIDLGNMLSRAFGSKLILCTSVTFGGTCRLAKVFFQSEDFSDPHLPAFLRVADSRGRCAKSL